MPKAIVRPLLVHALFTSLAGMAPAVSSAAEDGACAASVHDAYRMTSDIACAFIEGPADDAFVVSLPDGDHTVWAIASGASGGEDAGDRPRVLIERSHEWLFAHDDLGHRMLRPAGFEVVLSDASLGAKEGLGAFDIVMVEEGANSFEYSEAERRLLESYVREGGRLLIVGGPGRPIARVASVSGGAAAMSVGLFLAAWAGPAAIAAGNPAQWKEKRP